MRANRSAGFRRRALLVGLVGVLGLTSSAWGSIVYKTHSWQMTNPNLGDASTTLTIAEPGSKVVGDFMLAHITYEKGFDATVTAPADWNPIELDNQSSDIGQAVYWKATTGSEPTSYSWGFSQPVKAAGAILRYGGVNTVFGGDPSQAILASNGNVGDSATLTAPSINVGVIDRALLVALFGMKKKDVVLSLPPGMTSRYLEQNPQDVRIRAADELFTLGGATGTRVSTSGAADKWVAHLVALRANTIPVYTAPAAVTELCAEEEACLDLGSFVDPDHHGSWSITVNWGDGNEELFDFTSAGGASSKALGCVDHTYAAPGDYTLSVTVNDGIETASGTSSVGVIDCDEEDPEDPEDPVGITREGFTTGCNTQSGTSTLTLNSPFPVMEGQIMFAQVTFEKGNEVDFTKPGVVPAGWTLVRRDHFSSDLGQAVFRKATGASEPNTYTWGFKKADRSTLQVRACGAVLLFSGVDPVSPVVQATGKAADTKTLTAPSASVETGSVVLGFFGIKKQTSLSVPVGMDGIYQVQHANQSGPTIRAATESWEGADGTTGARSSIAGEKEKAVAQIVVLRAAE